MRPLCVLIAAVCLLPGVAQGQVNTIAELDRGHRILLEEGLQIQALALDRTTFVPSDWEDLGFTTVNWWAIPNVPLMGPPPGFKWSRWLGGRDIPTDVSLPPLEQPYLDNLVSLQAGDEQDLTDPTRRAKAADTLAQWRTLYPDVLGVLSQMSDEPEKFLPFLDEVQPDLLASGVYELNDPDPLVFGNPVRRGGNYQKMLERMQNVRLAGLGGHAGTGGAPFPYGVFTQTFIQPDADEPDFNFIASEAQMRHQLYSAWAMGFKWVCAFIYDMAPGEIYESYFFDPATKERRPGFFTYQQLNFESLNLAPALVRLLSTDLRIVSGRYINPFCIQPDNSLAPCEEVIPLPQQFEAWTPNADPYITNVQVTNLGDRNDGLPGDLMLGYFEPLVEAFDGPEYTGENYFMLVNTFAYQDASPAQTRQRVRFTFDFGDTGITALQRLSPFTGQVETVPLQPLANGRYRLDWTLDGGSGDLFKFDTGAPFIVADTPAAQPSVAVTIDQGPIVSLPLGETLLLTAAVSPASPDAAYQWKRDTGAKIPDVLAGETGPTYEIESVTFEDTGAYWCEVTVGGEVFISSTVNVIVAGPVPAAGGMALALLATLCAAGAGAALRRRV